MAAKLREKDGFYWVVVHYQGRRKRKKIGKDKREALKVVHMVNAQLALGTFSLNPLDPSPPVEATLWCWYEDYRPTFSTSFAQLAEINIRLHLVPFFGKLTLAEIEERDILRFIAEKIERAEKPLRASTLTNILSVLRRVMTLAVEEKQLSRNPCQNLGKLLAKVHRHQSDEVEHVSAWTREEVVTLLEVAKAEEPRFHPLLTFLLSTGCRKGEGLGLKWEDVDFADSRILIRRALVRGQLGTPKSGRARFVVLSPALAAILHDLFAQRRRECLARGWGSVPEFVFCSETGGLLNERNVARTWDRLRRKAQCQGVRPLRLHDCRHTFASLALASGKSVRWVATQLGHANPELTLRVYAHTLREEETDLSFLDFGGTKRHPRGTEPKQAAALKKPLRVTPRRGLGSMERETGIEPATLSLGS